MDLKLLPNNAMTFTENQHGNAVLEKLRQQRELDRCCDVILHVDGKQFHAHRCVLSACSPFFDSLFKASKTVKEQLTISADSSEVFHIMLAYMYTGTVIVDKKNVSELLKLANKLLLSKLKEYCAEYLQRYLDTKNCLTVLEMANKYCLESLQKTANSHIASHLREVIKGEEILDVSLPRLENFIKSTNWRLSNEDILYLVTSWVFYILDSRETNFRSLLTWISWKEIDPGCVISAIQDHDLFSVSRKCHSFLLDVLNEHGLLSQSGYDGLAVVRTREEENVDEEDNERIFNIAITTAISETLLEPCIDKYLMDGGKELLRDLPYEQTHMELRDLNQPKGLNQDFQQYFYSSNGPNSQGKLFQDNGTIHSNSNYNQNIDLEELCKYTIENTQKAKPQFIDSNNCETNVKQNEYENIAYGNDPPNCCHYRDYRDNENFTSQNNEKCPKMTNKVSYMNHKYDASYSNHISSFSDVSCQKTCSGPAEINSQIELSKDNNSMISGINYSSEPTSVWNGNITTKDTASDVCESFIENANLNPFPDFKCNSLNFNAAQSDILYMDCSDDTQSSNNCPQDMSLPHLKLSEFNEALNLQSSREKNSLNVDSIEVDNSVCAVSERGLLAPTQEEVPSTPSLCKDESSRESADGPDIPPSRRETRKGRKNDSKEEKLVSHPDLELENKASRISSGRRKKNQASKENRATVKKQREQRVKKDVSKKEEKSLNKKGDPQSPKPCDLCDASFGRKKEFFSHMMTHFPGPPHRCDTCMSSFQRIYYLLDHRQTHSETKPFQCSFCSFTTRRKCNLKDHMTRHSNQKPFKCEQCGFAFSRKRHLEVHKTKHTNDRPLVCETCGWTGKTRNCLTFHSKIHKGDLYSCQHPGCVYQTPKKSRLQEHMQYHTKSRPFTCEICDKRFISKSHLKRHLLKHEAPDLHKCPHCDYSSSRSDGLKIHVKRKHSSVNAKHPPRKNQLKKKDALHANNINKHEFPPINSSNEQQHIMPNLNIYRRDLSPPPTFQFSPTLSQYPNQSSSPTFGGHDDPDNPLAIVSEIEDDNPTLSFHQSPYLEPAISHPFSGLLDAPCGSGRFALSSHDDLYYNDV